MRILSDTGGTNARFAIEEDGQIYDGRTYKAANFPLFEEAFEQYKRDVNLTMRPQALLMATAAQPDGQGLWHFATGNRWVLDPRTLREMFGDVPPFINDFEANAWSIAGNVKTDELKHGENADTSVCLVGPGSGLGLAFMHASESGRFVVPTMGAHMELVTATEEQWAIKNVIQSEKRAQHKPERVIFEDVLCGPGLVKLYNAVCKVKGASSQAATSAEILDQPNDPQVQSTILLFHEFFGLCAEQIVQNGNAYGGLYITGGLMQGMRDRNLFDWGRAEKSYLGGHVEIIERKLDGVPVHHVTDPHASFKGLVVRDAYLKMQGALQRALD